MDARAIAYLRKLVELFCKRNVNQHVTPTIQDLFGRIQAVEGDRIESVVFWSAICADARNLMNSLVAHTISHQTAVVITYLCHRIQGDGGDPEIWMSNVVENVLSLAQMAAFAEIEKMAKETGRTLDDETIDAAAGAETKRAAVDLAKLNGTFAFS